MALKGKAKTEYQREYMRRRRAQAASTEKLEARIRELKAELARAKKAKRARREP